MNKKKSSAKLKSSYVLPVLFIGSIVIWLFSFRNFLNGSIAFTSDAAAYYNHFKFFVENMAQGIFPLWDFRWNSGVPNEFFLRRIGSFNPFFFPLILAVKLGVHFGLAYVLFLSSYWFLGCFGFFLLCKKVTGHTTAAFLGFALLYFSSLATRLFDSYIILVFVPMIWFFFFLVSFLKNPKRFFFLGILLCTMILLTTYVPFYFLIILATFVVVWSIVFMNKWPEIIKIVFHFARENMVICVLAVFLAGLAFVPGIRLMIEGKAGEIVLPNRSYSATSDQAFEVGYETTTQWAILEEFVYAQAFKDLKDFKFALIYIPAVVWILLLLGIFTRSSRLAVFLVCTAVLFFLMGSPSLSPVYDFLRKYLFIFKFFRNLHFFLWLAILPLFIMFACLKLKDFLEMPFKNVILRLSVIGLVHLTFLGLIYKFGVLNISTLISIVLSLIAFVIFTVSRNNLNPIGLLILWLAVTAQPLEAYHYLQMNRKPAVPNNFSYVYDVDQSRLDWEDYYDPDDFKIHKKYLYYSTKWFSELDSQMNWAVVHNYSVEPITVYDRVQYMDEASVNYREVDTAFRQRENRAFISAEAQSGNLSDSFSEKYSDKNTKIIKRNTNRMILKTDFENEKFLVFNDAYSKNWNAWIDGKKTKIFKANIAFKGVFVPAGEHKVVFRYGSRGLYVFNYMMLVVYMGVFGFLVYYGVKLGKERNDG